MVEQLARQHSQLEHQCKKTNFNTMEKSSHRRTNSNSSHASTAAEANPNSKDDCKSSESISNSEDEDDFHDAVADPEYVDFTVYCAPTHKRTASNVSGASTKSDGVVSHTEETDYSSDQEDTNTLTIIKKRQQKQEVADNEKNNKITTPIKRGPGRQRRSRIPDKPDISFSLWGIMKNCIGKDLSKIPVPVNFSEPISFLQRLCEDFEYSEILDRASMCSDDFEQMALVAAFTVSSYSSTAIRAGKPFNPLLGETFEFDRREDLGWRCIAEQVMHHPPMVAQFCESDLGGGWKCWQEFTMKSKFKGKYLEVEPLGITHLEFKNSGNHYTWRKVKTVVHNIVIGKLWIDQHGEMEVVNHTKGIKCSMKFEPYSYFGGTPKKVTGSVTNSEEKVEWVLNGTWDSKMEGSQVKGEVLIKGKSSLEVESSKLLWKKNPIEPEAEKYYFFSKFACELNEPEDQVAPTDSRLRPDQRLMEEGRWDEANTEKVRLEEKQRAVRRKREEESQLALQEGREYEGYQPTWFKTHPDEHNGGKLIHEYLGGYWEAKEQQPQAWGKCPDIF